MGSLFRGFRSLLFSLFLIASLTLNLALIVSPAVYGLASLAVSTVAGFVVPKAWRGDSVSLLSKQLDEQKRVNRSIREELADANAELLIERKARRELSTEVADLGAQVATERTARKQIRASVAGVSRRVEARAAKASVRETAAMGGEAIPFWGTAVIVSVTALELYDLCQTVVDMKELEAIFDPSVVVSEEDLTVCSMQVPSRRELWDSVSSAPGAAWNAARGAVPSLEEVQTFELPDMDWRYLGDGISSAASSVGSSITDAASATAEMTSTKWEQLQGWLND